MNIGIDLGRTIVDNTTRKPFEGAFEVIKQIIASGHDTFIVSRVNSEQRDRANKWLGETSFYPLTGFNQNNLYFCWERRDKAIFARYLHLDLFIDDRVDCLIPMDENVRKILFNPDEKNADQCAKSEANIVVASNWDEVKSYLWLANLFT